MSYQTTDANGNPIWVDDQGNISTSAPAAPTPVDPQAGWTDYQKNFAQTNPGVDPYYAGVFSSANAFNTATGYYGYVPHGSDQNRTGDILTAAAQAAGMPNFDFNAAAIKAVGSGGGNTAAGTWDQNSNPVQAADAILQASGIPALQQQVISQNDPRYQLGIQQGQQTGTAYNTDAQKYGPGNSDDWMKYAALVGPAIMTGGLASYFAGGGAAAGGTTAMADELSGGAGFGNGTLASTIGGSSELDGALTSGFNSGTSAANTSGLQQLASSGSTATDANVDDIFSDLSSSSSAVPDATETGYGSFLGADSVAPSQASIDAANAAGTAATSGTTLSQLQSLLGTGSTATSLIKSLLGGTAAQGAGAYSANTGGILGSLLGYLTGGQNANALQGVASNATAIANPFASQYPFYQQQLQQMYTDPNYFNNSSVLQGANQNAINDTTKTLASQGYNMTGNVLPEVAQRLQNNNMTYTQGLMNLTAQAAGANVNPGTAGQVAATTGTNAVNAANSQNVSLGNLFNTVLNGNQPTTAQQTAGTDPNATLGQTLSGLLS